MYIAEVVKNKSFVRKSFIER